MSKSVQAQQDERPRQDHAAVALICRMRPLVYREAPGEVLKLVESQVNVTAQLLSSLAAAKAGAEAEGSNALLVPLDQEHRRERHTSLQDLFEQAQTLHEQGGPCK